MFGVFEINVKQLNVNNIFDEHEVGTMCRELLIEIFIFICVVVTDEIETSLNYNII